MNDFTKYELEMICKWGESYTEFGTSWTEETDRVLIKKIQSIIDNYSKFDTKKIVQSHLNEASSLINHAMGLLGLNNE